MSFGKQSNGGSTIRFLALFLLGLPSGFVVAQGSGDEVEWFDLEASAACTREMCEPDDPCCHSCNFVDWGVEGLPAFAGEGVSLPQGEVDGCGQALSRYQVSGFAEEDRFVVSGVRPTEAIAAGDMRGFETESTGGVVLSPTAVCTDQYCMPEDPCCNACGLQGWRAQGLPVVPAEGVELPFPALNGCGQTNTVFIGWGEFEGDTFVLRRWE
ncbi:MAG: hypothetical protein KC561_11930, partial [Myxococcales bacterium]|nr:hypothetical protein [Myxococcales bacterium]